MGSVPPCAPRTARDCERQSDTELRTLPAMNATTFDTLAAMRRLEKAGVDAEHAEAIIDTMRESAGEISTKSDIERLDSRLNTLQWVVGIQSAITLATFGIVAAKLL